MAPDPEQLKEEPRCEAAVFLSVVYAQLWEMRGPSSSPGASLVPTGLEWGQGSQLQQPLQVISLQPLWSADSFLVPQLHLLDTCWTGNSHLLIDPHCLEVPAGVRDLINIGMLMDGWTDRPEG